MDDMTTGTHTDSTKTFGSPTSPHWRLVENRQPLMLGLFLPIYSGGWTMSTAARGTTWQFPYLASLTQKAERLGFEIALAPMHWLPKGGYGGTLGYRGISLDARTTAAALAAVTSQILLISTVHALHGPIHPLHVAKAGATLDHISNGRWGVNIVTGSHPSEPPMFGQSFLEHDLRFRIADEFTAILVELWQRDENLTFQGEHYSLQDAYVSPRPVRERPLIVTATGSPAGMAFAGRYADIVFITSPAGAEISAATAALPQHIARVREQALKAGRDVKIFINPLILCRETASEAWDDYRRIASAVDSVALDNFYRKAAVSDSKSHSAHDRERRIVGGNIQIVGDPQSVAEQLQALTNAGIDGVLVSFFDFAPELAFFGERVIPLLRSAGLRLDPTVTHP